MTPWKIYVLALLLTACRQRPSKAGSVEPLQPGYDGLPPSGWYYGEAARPFNPAAFIPELAADTGFHFVSSMQYGNTYQHTYYYCIYRMDKQRVLDILNGRRIISYIRANNDTVYARCEKTDTAAFLRNVVSPDEQHITPQNFFYGFKRMREYEIYSWFRGLQMHHVVFLKNSPLVYHRIIWLTY